MFPIGSSRLRVLNRSTHSRVANFTASKYLHASDLDYQHRITLGLRPQLGGVWPAARRGRDSSAPHGRAAPRRCRERRRAHPAPARAAPRPPLGGRTGLARAAREMTAFDTPRTRAIVETGKAAWFALVRRRAGPHALVAVGLPDPVAQGSPEQPILAAIDWIAAWSELCSPLWSWTIRTARLRTSGENGGVRFVMGSISQDQEPPGNPGRFTRRAGEWFGRFQSIRSSTAVIPVA